MLRRPSGVAGMEPAWSAAAASALFPAQPVRADCGPSAGEAPRADAVVVLAMNSRRARSSIRMARLAIRYAASLPLSIRRYIPMG